MLHIAIRASKTQNSGPAVGTVNVPDSMLARPRRFVEEPTLPLLPRAINTGRYVPRTNAARMNNCNSSPSTRTSTRAGVRL